MDGKSFDDLSRRVARLGSRRGLLGGLLSVALGLLTGQGRGAAHTAGSGASCQRAGLPCGQHWHCCSGHCRENVCRPRRRRKPRRAGCRRGLRRCSGACVNLRRHRLHCGRCGNACAAGKVCRQGRCVAKRPICTPNCAGKGCGANDGCGGTCNPCGPCQACTPEGTCQPLPDGTICGTRTGPDDYLRCCNGVCPAPACLPLGTACPNGDCTVCCTGGEYRGRFLIGCATGECAVGCPTPEELEANPEARCPDCPPCPPGTTGPICPICPPDPSGCPEACFGPEACSFGPVGIPCGSDLDCQRGLQCWCGVCRF